VTRPAVITGASSGIGEATAVALAALGLPVVLGARRLDRCEKTASAINESGGTAFAFPLDVASAGSREAFAAQAIEAVGDIEVFVSNAGLNQPVSALDATPADFEEHLAVNLLGVHALTQLFGAPMVARGHGDLCFVTSEVVREPRPWVAPYLASKFAAEGLVRALMMELEGTGVRVSCIRPGQTLTEMGFDWDPDRTAEILTSWKRWGLARHPHFMPASGIAAAVAACVTAPSGVSFAYVDVEPVPPPRKEKT
jgi:NAD(P)-dependent dehydrogenase (short-subunit alcohol dehydrogenase family)